VSDPFANLGLGDSHIRSMSAPIDTGPWVKSPPTEPIPALSKALSEVLNQRCVMFRDQQGDELLHADEALLRLADRLSQALVDVCRPQPQVHIDLDPAAAMLDGHAYQDAYRGVPYTIKRAGLLWEVSSPDYPEKMVRSGDRVDAINAFRNNIDLLKQPGEM
jgi:hypothetical protein